ncbi:trihelix transcription factor ASR3-like [Diospyros lotus]|uniref:trihelix transcription factor ASR3-like n=1 Tax=Diospyros lotus TaxID=55363 RepID=UPI00224CB624|nr:trihelix transcription factor ASR3-like [Diospyros lotus]
MVAEQHENNASSTNGVEGQQAPGEGSTDDKNRMLRHPRWSRQETLILIEGKQMAESRGLKCRRSTSVYASYQLESKWDSISSFCKQHGVNREPVQCRKRWSNILGDFRKIKLWESQVKEVADSFWMMRNDSRRENKLPGFFDREVYDVLDGKSLAATAYPLKGVLIADTRNCCGLKPVLEEEEEAKAIFDSSRHAAADNGLLSDFQQLAQEKDGKSIEEEPRIEDNPTKTDPKPMHVSEITGGKQKGLNFQRGFTSNKGRKRQLSVDGCQGTNLERQLIRALEKNSRMLNVQLEVQNMNYQLEREQWKDQNDSLVAALSKIVDALGKIADKL